jgi:hypothetical protein
MEPIFTVPIKHDEDPAVNVRVVSSVKLKNGKQIPFISVEATRQIHPGELFVAGRSSIAALPVEVRSKFIHYRE